MTLEVRTVIYLRERIAALQHEQPVTVAGRESLQAAIAELDASIAQVRAGALTLRKDGRTW